MTKLPVLPLKPLAKFVLEYRDFVANSRWYAHAGQKNSPELNYILLGIAGEAGETADQWKKITRVLGLWQGWEEANDVNRLKLFNEIGDVLWYIQCACIFAGIDLDELMLMNLMKLYDRMKGTDKEIPWPLSVLSYEDALKSMQHTEYQITKVSASPSTDTVTL